LREQALITIVGGGLASVEEDKMEAAKTLELDRALGLPYADGEARGKNYGRGRPHAELRSGDTLGALLATREASILRDSRAENAHSDNWSAIGRIVVRMEQQGFDFMLARDDRRGWDARFCPKRTYESNTWVRGHAVAPTPWLAVENAARAALNATWPAHGRSSPIRQTTTQAQ
jgi:hypothetical protein